MVDRRVKKYALAMLSALAVLLIAAVALASPEANGGGDNEFTMKAMIGIACGLGIGIAAFGGALGQGRTASAALDGIARNPQEFLGWLLIAAGRQPAGDRFRLAVEVAVALYGYIAGGEFDDEVIEEAESRIDGVLEFNDRKARARRSLHAPEHDAASPFEFFASRAREDVRDAQEARV